MGRLPPRVYHKHGAYYYVDRERKWHRLGKTEAEAYRAYAALLEGGTATLSDVMRRYSAEVLPGKAAATRRDQRRQMERLEAVFGEMSPASLTTQHVAEYLDRRGGVKANREVALLSHIYRKAIRWGIVSTNPCQGVERNPERPRTRYVTDEEFWARWEQVGQPLRLGMELLYLTGQRLGDVLSITDQHLSDSGILIDQGKTGARLALEWTPALKDVVKRCKRRPSKLDNPPLLRNNAGQAYTVSGFGAMWRKMAFPEGVQPFQLRDLRAKSASDHPSGSHLGHRSSAVLRRFYERKPREVRGL